jgi:hypothetical protein
MTDDVRQDETIQQSIRNLLIGSVPEREDQLIMLWQDLDLVFQFLSDDHKDGRLIMDAGSYRYIRINHRIMRSFWIGAFAAWEAYRAVLQSKDLPVNDLARFQELISAFETVIENDYSVETPLPAGIPEPGSLPDKNSDPQARAVSEISIIATAWALLHEVRHIRHQREGTSASIFGNTREARHNEEFSCDEFATHFILERVQRYSNENGHDHVLVRRKREMSVYFALFALTLLTKDRWSECDTHPSVQDRINAVCGLMGNDRDELAEAIAKTAFTTLQTLWPSAPMILFGERPCVL